MTEWEPQVCNVLSVVIVSCKLCCLNAVSKRKTLPRLGPHACCGMFIATLQSRKLKLVTTCGLGASRQDRPTCGYNPPASVWTLVTCHTESDSSEVWIFLLLWFRFPPIGLHTTERRYCRQLVVMYHHLLNIGPSMLFCNQNWATIWYLVPLLSFKATIFCNNIACSCRVASDEH